VDSLKAKVVQVNFFVLLKLVYGSAGLGFDGLSKNAVPVEVIEDL
jgi:hypothetical protein